MRRGKRRAARVSAGTDEAAALELIADDGPRLSRHIHAHLGLSGRNSAGGVLARLRRKGLVDVARVSKRGWGWWHLTVAGVAEIDRLEGAIAAKGVINRG